MKTWCFGPIETLPRFQMTFVSIRQSFLLSGLQFSAWHYFVLPLYTMDRTTHTFSFSSTKVLPSYKKKKDPRVGEESYFKPLSLFLLIHTYLKTPTYLLSSATAAPDHTTNFSMLLCSQEHFHLLPCKQGKEALLTHNLTYQPAGIPLTPNNYFCMICCHGTAAAPSTAHPAPSCSWTTWLEHPGKAKPTAKPTAGPAAGTDRRESQT